MTAKPKKATRADLERKCMELEAQLAGMYHFADAELHKAGDRLMGSAVIVQLHALGGREITKPFAIRDGLSADTIAALRRDIVRSYEGAIAFKPKGAA